MIENSGSWVMKLQWDVFRIVQALVVFARHVRNEIFVSFTDSRSKGGQYLINKKMFVFTNLNYKMLKLK